MENKFLIHLGLDILGLNRNLLSLSQKCLLLAKMALITWRLLIILSLPGFICLFSNLKLYVWGIPYIIFVLGCSLLIAREVNIMILNSSEKKPTFYWLLIITGSILISVFVYLPTVIQLYIGDKLFLLSYGYSFTEILGMSKNSLAVTLLLSLLIIAINTIPFYLIMNVRSTHRLVIICINKKIK